MSNTAILRLTREISDLSKNPDHQIFIHHDEADIMSMKAMITGPPNTPYCLGQFEFCMDFPRDYPSVAPKVLAMTHSHQRVRFNPNIYADGKVCLSILGTWRGDSGEQWSSAHGISSILLSIQSLMSDTPYRNEPGHDRETDPKKLEGYSKKIRHETIRVSICDRLEQMLKIHNGTALSAVVKSSTPNTHTTTSTSSPTTNTTSSSSPAVLQPKDKVLTPTPTSSPSTSTYQLYASSVSSCGEFDDLSKRLFLCYYFIYQNTVQTEGAQIPDGTPFFMADFEFGSNSMKGSYTYSTLAQRLKVIHDAIYEETADWMKESWQWIKQSQASESHLRRQFEQVREYFRQGGTCGVDVELVEDNPYHWVFTLFGKPMSNYDDGMFRVQMILHDKFPDIQPRVKFLTPIYHVHVNAEGVPFYTCKKPDDVRSHIEAIHGMIFSEDPSPNPSTHINIEAAKLCFGTPEQKREYSRNARRSASRSTEYCD